MPLKPTVKLRDLRIFANNGKAVANQLRPYGRKREGSLEELHPSSRRQSCIVRPVVTKRSDKKRRSFCTEGHRKKWMKLLHSYALETSFHGPKFIVEEQPFKARRAIWLMIFLAGTAIFLMQTITSIQRYHSFPISVDVSFNYNYSIQFPSVTVCNSNSFRATKAYENDYYTMITDVYGNPEFRNLSKYEPTPRLDELFSITGHSIDDLILSCTWNGVQCQKTDFKTTFTDCGKCYTFNGKDTHPVKEAIQTGTNGGLNLKLNIEQYEYMLGPNGGAGLKVLIHHPDDIPLVKDHALAIPPGSHGFIGITTLEVVNLPPKYGKCNDSVILDYFDDYTVPNCYINCKEKFLRDRCHCRDIYMPEKQGRPLVCNIDQYNSCMQKANEEFNLDIKPRCQSDCPVPCKMILYEPRVSYASISNFDIDVLLHRNETAQLQKKYVAARETTQRVNQAIVERDTNLIAHLQSTVERLDRSFSSIETHLEVSCAALQDNYESLLRRTHFHMNSGLKHVEYIEFHDFIRGWMVYKERSFHYVTLNFMDFPFHLRRAVKYANNTISLSNRTHRHMLYSPVDLMFCSRKKLLNRALSFMNESHNAYTTGEPLIRFRLTPDRRYDSFYISLGLLHSGNYEQDVYYQGIVDAINQMQLGIDTLMEIGTEFVESGEFNTEKFQYGEDQFIIGGKRFNYRVFQFEERVVYKPNKVIAHKIEDFERLNRTFSQDQSNVEWKLSQIRNLLQNFKSQWQNVLNAMNMSVDYLQNTWKMKTPLGKEMTSFKMADSIRKVALFFQNVRSRERELHDMLTVSASSYKDVWTSMLTEQTTSNFYHGLIYNDTQDFLSDNDTSTAKFYLPYFADLLGMTEEELEKLPRQEVVSRMNADFKDINVTEKMEDIDREFRELKNSLALSVLMGHSDAVFLTTMERYVATMKTFIDGNVIDTDFFKENFMTLDVFMQELSYEEIEQQEAYDIPQMLSDIGGSMGLFIGGSVLSVFEFLDVFLHYGAKLLLRK